MRELAREGNASVPPGIHSSSIEGTAPVGAPFLRGGRYALDRVSVAVGSYGVAGLMVACPSHGLLPIQESLQRSGPDSPQSIPGPADLLANILSLWTESRGVGASRASWDR